MIKKEIKMKKGIVVKKENLINVTKFINEKIIKGKIGFSSWDHYVKDKEQYSVLVLHVVEEFENYIKSNENVILIFEAESNEKYDKFIKDNGYVKK